MANELQNIENEGEENLSNKQEKREREEREYRKLKIKLEDLHNRKNRYSLLFGIFTAVLVGIIFFLYLGIDSYQITFFKVVCSVIVSVFIGICTAIYAYMTLDLKENTIRRKMLEYEAEDIKEEVQEDVFENSIKMSYKYLDQYYLQTREQAQKGFFVTVCVSVFGAILLGVGIVAMFLEKTEPSYVTCASGVITEFIAAIFFYLYNKTVMSMSKYHNKLVLSQNISIALKVSDSLPDEDKTKSKNMIIEELLKDINSYLINSDSEGSKNDMKEGQYRS